MATTVLSKATAQAGRAEVASTPGASGATGATLGTNAAPNFRNASDDEILNLSPRVVPKKKASAQTGARLVAQEGDAENGATAKDGRASPDDELAPTTEPLAEGLRAVLDEHPELRTAWEDATAYRESFASPEEAREATRLVGDLNRLDALFFSARPEDHAELAKIVAQLDPAAAASLARELGELATESQRHRDARERNAEGNVVRTEGLAPGSFEPKVQTTDRGSQNTPTPAQAEFFHAANAAAVGGVLDAIHAQVDRLLPEGTSQAARNRVVGEIYRELDASLRANRQLNQQVRQAFRSGTLDASHQRAIVSLITSRARQSLPGVAKRVMSEWTTALVSAGEERRSRQRTAEARVDIGGSGRSGADGRRTLSPREIDYSRLSDADILNL